MGTVEKAGAMAAVVAMMFVSLSVYAAERAPDQRALAQKAGISLRASVRSLGLQTELPSRENGKIRIGTGRKQTGLRSWGLSPNVATYLFYGALGAIVVVILATLRDNFRNFSRSRRLEADVEESAPAVAAERMERAQSEADELARRGNFAEAIHALLIQSVSEMHRHLYVSISASLTSREMLRHVDLPSEGRDVFADIVARVEVSYFGRQRPLEQDYLACRSSFDTLTRVLRNLRS
jgi:hypothetical protein